MPDDSCNECMLDQLGTSPELRANHFNISFSAGSGFTRAEE